MEKQGPTGTFAATMQHLTRRLKERLCAAHVQATRQEMPKEIIADLLKLALAMEVESASRDRQNHELASRRRVPLLADHFLQRALWGEQRVEAISRRIAELGGPDPVALEVPTRSANRDVRPRVSPVCFVGLIHEEIAAERIAIEGYRGIADFARKHDSSSSSLVSEMALTGERYVLELQDLVAGLPPASEPQYVSHH